MPAFDDNDKLGFAATAYIEILRPNSNNIIIQVASSALHAIPRRSRSTGVGLPSVRLGQTAPARKKNNNKYDLYM